MFDFNGTPYTINDPARMLELTELGVTGIFTDRPDLLRALLAQCSG
jgi:glycerophosphoryl diester phosphodiesterase